MIPDVQVNLHPASQIPSLFRKSCLEFRKSIKKSSPEVAQNVNTKEQLRVYLLTAKQKVQQISISRKFWLNSPATTCVSFVHLLARTWSGLKKEPVFGGEVRAA